MKPRQFAQEVTFCLLIGEALHPGVAVHKLHVLMFHRFFYTLSLFLQSSAFFPLYCMSDVLCGS